MADTTEAGTPAQQMPPERPTIIHKGTAGPSSQGNPGSLPEDTPQSNGAPTGPAFDGAGIDEELYQAQLEAATQEAEAATQQPRALVVEFPGVQGFTYVYDFDDLEAEQIMLAEAVFNLHNRRQQKPPRDFRELDLSGDMDYMAAAFGYLLRRKTPTGLAPFDRRAARDEVKPFVAKLKGSQWADLQKCKNHFFTQVGILDYESITQLEPLIAAAVNAQSAGIQQPNDPAPTGNNS